MVVVLSATLARKAAIAHVAHRRGVEHRLETLGQRAARQAGSGRKILHRPVALGSSWIRARHRASAGSASAASQPTEPGCCRDDLMAQKLDEGDLREPLQHGKPAGARAVHLVTICAIVARSHSASFAPRADMQERWQRVPQRPKVHARRIADSRKAAAPFAAHRHSAAPGFPARASAAGPPSA